MATAPKTKTARRKAPAKKTGVKRAARGKTTHPKRPVRKWSQRVTEHSDALDLQDSVFKLRSPAPIARSLKRSAERSHRRKSSPYRSAMSMLTFYINRAGKNLSAPRRRTLDRAKDELRKVCGKPPT